MRVGRTRPKGFLPVYSVDTEAEARELVVITCSRDSSGNYWSRELAAARLTPATSMAEIDKQLDSLDDFSKRLDKAHKVLKAKGFCHCKDAKR